MLPRDVLVNLYSQRFYAISAFQLCVLAILDGEIQGKSICKMLYGMLIRGADLNTCWRLVCLTHSFIFWLVLFSADVYYTVILLSHTMISLDE